MFSKKYVLTYLLIISKYNLLLKIIKNSPQICANEKMFIFK